MNNIFCKGSEKKHNRQQIVSLSFNYARQLPPSQLNGEVRDTLYWQLISKSPNNNTDRKGLLRLWNIHAKYHLGDSQDFVFYDWFYGTFSSDRGGRFVSATPMTDWFVGFNGQFIYQDAHYAFIYFNPSSYCPKPS